MRWPSPDPDAATGPRPAPAAALLVAIVVTLAACTASPVPSPTSGPSATATMAAPSVGPVDSPTPVPGSSETPAATLPTQTDTAWGRIWDGLPAGFPQFADSSPTSTGSGPASGQFDVTASAVVVATFYRSALENAGFTTAAFDGPLEDGGYVIDSATTGGCAVRTTVAPLGGSVTITILYGAACPFPS
jgi:hypothetical protein